MRNYGKCHVCGGKMKAALVKQDFWVKGKLVVIDGVPAGVCSQCGEKVVRAGVGRDVAALLVNTTRLRSARKLAVPVLKLAKQSV
jgi:HTH-type transcriptional regulator/antitoxin MqsA